MKTYNIKTLQDRENAQEAVYDLDLASEWRVEITRVVGARTLTQNKAMHKYFEMLAAALNDAGWDMKRTLRQEIEIPWTKESAKEFLWKPIQRAMLMKDSTTEMTTAEPGDIYLVLDRYIADKFGVSVPWPSNRDGG